MMISLFCLARKRVFEEVQANIGNIIFFASEYADDRFNGGVIDEILKFFQEESRLAEEFELRTTSIIVLFIFLLETVRRNIKCFQSLGVRDYATCNIQILKAPISRSPEFLAESCQNEKSDFEWKFKGLEGLDQKYIVFHFFQACMGWS